MNRPDTALSILHINTHDVAGGAAKVASRLACAQRAVGCRAAMLVGEKLSNDPNAFSFPIEKNRHLHPVCLQSGQLYYEFQGSHRLVFNPHVRAADILHLHNLHGGYFNPFSLSPLSHGRPVVWTLHDMQALTGHCAHAFDCDRWRRDCRDCPNLSVDPALFVDNASNLLADKKRIYDHSFLHIVVPSRWLHDKVAQSVLRDHPMDLIYNGVDTDVFRPHDKQEARHRFGIPPDHLAVGAIAHGGTLANPWKGGRHTQAVLNALNGAGQFVFVNIGDNRPSQDPRIINIPHIADETALAFAYSAIDIFLYTPNADNCPLVVLEALACGLPIAAFDTGGVPELVRDGQEGLITPAGDIPAITRSLIDLVRDAGLRGRLAAAARRRAVTTFDHKRIAGQYLDLYHRCIAECRRRAGSPMLFVPGAVPRVVDNDVFRQAEKAKPRLLALSTKREAGAMGRRAVPVGTAHPPVAAGLPKISIVTPSFNQGAFLEECIDSVLSQGYPNLEYIIMDGGSTDGSVDIIRKYEKHLSYWQSTPDGGQYAAIQAGFDKSTGSIMAWLNSDDKYHRDAFWKVAYVFSRYPDIQWLTGRPTAWDAAGRLINVGWVPLWSRVDYLQTSPRFFIQQESTFWTRTLWQRAGGRIRTDLRFAGDCELWLRFFKHTRLHTLDAWLAGFRHHPGQKTKCAWQDYTEEARRVLQDEIDHNDCPRELAAPQPLHLDSMRLDGFRNSACAAAPRSRTGVVRATETRPVSVAARPAVTIVTSIAPSRIGAQENAVRSWLDLGFRVISVNCREEVDRLAPAFPRVEFMAAPRDARDLYGKPLVYLDDVLGVLAVNAGDLCGIVNADIHLSGDRGLLDFIEHQASQSLFYGSRLDVDALGDEDGTIYNCGFDFFFFDKSLIARIPASNLCLGMPWWDYHLPVAALLNGAELRRLTTPVARHIRHTFEWSGDHWGRLASEFFQSLRGGIDLHFNGDEKTNPWTRLGRRFAEHHRRYLKENDLHDSSQLSLWTIVPCILEFLASESVRVAYHSRRPLGVTTVRSLESDAVVPVEATPSTGDRPDLSVVLSTKNRAGLLDAALGSIKAAADGLKYEFIIIDGDSTDGTREVLGRHGINRVYRESEHLGQGHHSWPALYNFGFSKATGRYAMYASDDMSFNTGALAEAVHLLDTHSDGVAGGMFFYRNVHPAQPFWAEFGIDFTYGARLLMNYGLFRLDAFRHIGGLDESYRFYCADTDFCYRLYDAGLHLIPLPCGLVTHHNILDAQKQSNLAQADDDIRRLLARWRHKVSADLPDPRRLFWRPDMAAMFDIVRRPGFISDATSAYWRALALLQDGRTDASLEQLILARDQGLDAPQVRHLLEKHTRPGASRILGTGRVPLRTIIFSKDRAMQLRATLESLLMHCTDADLLHPTILYKVSTERHRRQYEKLAEEFPTVAFLAESDFRGQLLGLVGSCDHVLLLVDDNIFVREFSAGGCIAALSAQPAALGFSLRLGRNTRYCYPRSVPQTLPEFRPLRDGVLEFNWTTAEHDFAYPFEVSSSLYRAADLLVVLEHIEFANPNTLEEAFAAQARLFAETRPLLLCPATSVAFCNPVNVVQSVRPNRCEANPDYTAEALAGEFDAGRRIDVGGYAGFTPEACHHPVEIRLVEAAGGPRPKPRFSVIMANYNNGPYIAEAIRSVLSQTFTDWELIIVDDGSTDDSLAEIARIASDPRVRVLHHDVNKGYTAALKTAIAAVSADVFGILDSDDALTPRAIETMHQAHLERPDAGLIYSQFIYCGADLTPRKTGFCGPIGPGASALDENHVSHFKTFKTAYYHRTGGYDEAIVYAEDVDIVYKMEEIGGLFFVDEPLYLYRELPTSIAHSKDKVNIAILSRVRARLNALKRRTETRARSSDADPEALFADAVNEALARREDVRQYFALVRRLYARGLIENLPDAVHAMSDDRAILWIVGHIDVPFHMLLARRKTADRSDVSGSPSITAPPVSAASSRREPLVSVCMVAYNAEPYIAQAIASVLGQSFEELELLIVNDGSTDRTADIMTAYGDRRIRCIHKEHKNFASGLNRAIREAASRYILNVDADDFISPDYIDGLVRFAEQHPEADYVYPAALTLVDSAGCPTGELWRYEDFPDSRILPAFLLEHGFGPVPNPGSLKRRSLYDRTGLYDEVDTVEDFVFLCRHAPDIRFCRCDFQGRYFYRRLPGGNSHRYEQRNRIMAEALGAMVERYPAERLCPHLAAIEDPDDRAHCFHEYLAEVFGRYARGPMVRFPQFYQRLADKYRARCICVRESRLAAVSVPLL
ncbi:MAG TPA: glycosyltransferase [Phycisphaerales bacterium]|nr:glycosyltransferase [Phycisphaerales bacterium]